MVGKVEKFVESDHCNPIEGPVEECSQLTLDSCMIKVLTNEDAEYLKRFKKLSCLSMTQCKLVSLDNLPIFPNLETLILYDNRLSGRKVFEQIVASCPRLTSLYIAGNRFDKIDDLEPLKTLQTLEEIDIEKNPCCPEDFDKIWTDKLFQTYPTLTIVNGRDAKGDVVETESSEDEDGDDPDLVTNDDKSKKSLISELMSKNFNDADDDDEEDDYNPESDSESYSDDSEYSSSPHINDDSSEKQQEPKPKKPKTK